jgi:hypothetical protein
VRAVNRKIVGVVVALVLVLVAVWFFALRDKPSAPAKQAPKPPPPKTDIWANAGSAASSDAPAPKGVAPKWQLDIDPEGPLRLEGQVQDADGHGVGGAEVWLGSVPPRTTKTEEDGSFAFDKLVGREYALSASAGDRVGGPVEYKLTDSSDPVVIRLVVGSSLVVGVKDDSDKPVEGAEVKLVSESLVSAKTATDGTATLKPVRAGWVGVQVNAAGYAPGTGFTQVAGGGASGRVDVRLHKGFSVEGRVVDEQRKPIAGAHVGTAALWGLPAGSQDVVTDTDGKFKIPALPAGTHALMASDGEHAPARSAPVTVADRPVTGVEIMLRDGGTLVGTVVDEAGKAVPYATIRVGGSGQQMYTVAARQATSDKAGAFELRGLDRAKLKARAEADAAASKVADVDLSTEPKVTIKLVLDVKGIIAGAVVDETGAAVAEVQVNAFPDILGGEAPESLSLAGMSSATTDGAGKFTIRGLPDGGYRVRASRASGTGVYEWGQQGVAAKTGDKNVRITLNAPGSIIGKIAVEGGDAPKGARVMVGYQAPVQVADDGSFKIAETSAGKHDLHIHGANFAAFNQRDVDVKPGKQTDVGTITVTRGRRVVGTVVDGAGNKVAGARVKIGDMIVSIQGAEEQMETFDEMYGGKSTTTDQDGKFVLVGIPKKATNLLAEHAERGRSNAIGIPAGTDDPPALTLALRGFGTISGKVTSQGKPVPNAAVTDTPKGGGTQMRMAQTDDNGAFTITKVSEGAHTLSAMQQAMMSMKSTSVTVQVTSGKETKVNIDIPVGNVTLSVQVKPLPNQKIDAAQVFLMRGVVAMHNAKQLTDAFLGGGVQGMKFWFGEGKPQPEFEELVAGDYSVCTIPINGDLSDQTFQARLQEHLQELKVYCKQAKVLPSPAKQAFVHEVPAMTPLPAN